MNEISYDINVVIRRLSGRIAELEVQLAHVQAVNEAYVKRIEELEEKLKEKENAE